MDSQDIKLHVLVYLSWIANVLVKEMQVWKYQKVTGAYPFLVPPPPAKFQTPTRHDYARSVGNGMP